MGDFAEEENSGFSDGSLEELSRRALNESKDVFDGEKRTFRRRKENGEYFFDEVYESRFSKFPVFSLLDSEGLKQYPDYNNDDFDIEDLNELIDVKKEYNSVAVENPVSGTQETNISDFLFTRWGEDSYKEPELSKKDFAEEEDYFKGTGETEEIGILNFLFTIWYPYYSGEYNKEVLDAKYETEIFVDGKGNLKSEDIYTFNNIDEHHIEGENNPKRVSNENLLDEIFDIEEDDKFINHLFHDTKYNDPEEEFDYKENMLELYTIHLARVMEFDPTQLSVKRYNYHFDNIIGYLDKTASLPVDEEETIKGSKIIACLDIIKHSNFIVEELSEKDAELAKELRFSRARAYSIMGDVANDENDYKKGIEELDKIKSDDDLANKFYSLRAEINYNIFSVSGDYLMQIDSLEKAIGNHEKVILSGDSFEDEEINNYVIAIRDYRDTVGFFSELAKEMGERGKSTIDAFVDVFPNKKAYLHFKERFDNPLSDDDEFYEEQED